MAKQKGGLGRGLNALFEDSTRPAVAPAKSVTKEEKKEEPAVAVKNPPASNESASVQQAVQQTQHMQQAVRSAAQPVEKTASKAAADKKPSGIYISEDALEHAKVVSREARKPVQRTTANARPSNTASFNAVNSAAPAAKASVSRAGSAMAGSAAKPVQSSVSAAKTPAAPKPAVKTKPAASLKPAPKKPEKGDVGLVAIEKIQPNPDQPRTNFKEEEIEELAASIKKEGLLQPILVRKEGDHYQIIAGERRWQACKNLKMKEIPVRFWSADKDKALELALIENIQRSDLNPIEEAYGYKRLMERKGMTQSEIAQTVSKGRSTIANALRLLDLPEDAQQLLFEEKITAGHARAILSIPDAEGRKTLTKKLVEQKLSVRETESIARLLSGRAKAAEMGANKRVPAPASFKKAAKGLTRYLSVPVRVKTVQGKNKIEIQFKDEEELQRIIKLISDVQNAREKESTE